MDLSRHAHRKDEHLSLAEKFYTPTATSQFDQLRFVHQSLPEISLTDVDFSTQLGPLSLKVPLMIEAMTGGSHERALLTPNWDELPQRLAWRSLVFTEHRP